MISSSLTLEEVRDVLELRDLPLAVAAVLLQQREDVVELAAGVGLEQPLQVLVDGGPVKYKNIKEAMRFPTFGIMNDRSVYHVSTSSLV